jgi:hypothetical protein
LRRDFVSIILVPVNESAIPSSHVGGTVVAILVGTITLLLVSGLASILMTFLYHFIGWMPWTLAQIFGL